MGSVTKNHISTIIDHCMGKMVNIATVLSVKNLHSFRNMLKISTLSATMK